MEVSELCCYGHPRTWLVLWTDDLHSVVRLTSEVQDQVDGLVQHTFVSPRLGLDVRNQSLRHRHGARAYRKVRLGKAAWRARGAQQLVDHRRRGWTVRR